MNRLLWGIAFCSLFMAEISETKAFSPFQSFALQTSLPISLVDSTEEDSISTLEVSCLLNGLVNVQKSVPEIQVALHLSSTNNFTETALYVGLKKAYLHKETVAMLAQANSNLKAIHPGYSILILDAAQPFSVQKKLAILATQKLDKSNFNHLETGKKPGIKCYGVAVDVTIVDEKGTPLDMGTNYFAFEPQVQPKMESKYLKSNTLTETQVNNRLLLRKVMTEAGFIQSDSKWWQFESVPRKAAAKKYQALE